MCDIDPKILYLDIFWDFIDNNNQTIFLSVLLCWHLKEHHGQLTPDLFCIFFLFCVVHSSDRNSSFPIRFMGIFTFKPFFSKSVHHQVKFLYLGCYQEDEMSINKINLYNGEETQKLHLKRYIDVFTHCSMQNKNAFNLQLQMQK